MKRLILHLDLDAFFCAVEEQRDPALRGIAFAVGGNPQQRGVVASCSYAARQFGIHSAMPMSQAKRKCPHLVIVQHHFDLYREKSSEVMHLLNQHTPFVEQLSIDEAFLDVTGLRRPALSVARSIQEQINTELGLPCSLGAANSKLVAKIANNMGKARSRTGLPPNAIEIVPDGEEAAYLAPLPIRELWGIGEKTAEKLYALGIHTIGDIAAQHRETLVAALGKSGHDMWQHANAIDARPVISEHETKSVSAETTFERDISSEVDLKRTLRQLSDRVGRRLRTDKLRGSTIRIKLRWADFSTVTRQLSLVRPTNDDADIYSAAEKLLADNWPKGRPVRLLGVGVSNLEEGMTQLDLWQDEDSGRNRKLQDTLDTLRHRYGDSSVKRGSDISSE